MTMDRRQDQVTAVRNAAYGIGVSDQASRHFEVQMGNATGKPTAGGPLIPCGQRHG